MQPLKLAFEAIGTAWEIDIWHMEQAENAASLKSGIAQIIKDFDTAYSRFREDSLIRKLVGSSQAHEFPKNAQKLFELYHKLYELTDGLFTPLVGDILEDLGYDTEYSLREKVAQAAPAWEEVLEVVGSQVRLKQPTVLDFGAAGKGYLVDLVAEFLEQQGVNSYCVDGSGDLKYQHAKGKVLDVGLEHPKNNEQVIGVAHVLSQSLCGSAGNRRRWGKYHHIINPQTLASPSSVQAVWVVADSTMLADALTTCLFFVEPERLLKEFEFEYAVVRDDFSLHKSSAFPAEFFTN